MWGWGGGWAFRAARGASHKGHKASPKKSSGQTRRVAPVAPVLDVASYYPFRASSIDRRPVARKVRARWTEQGGWQ